jgi:PAS domain S-box-containing protein
MNDSNDPDSAEAQGALRRRVAELEAELAECKSASSFLESVLQAVPAFITKLDPDLNIRFFNRYQPGHSIESVVGRSVFDYMAPADHEIARRQIERARTTGEIVSYTLQGAIGAHGAPASYLTRVAPVREPDGRVGVCLAFVDTTEETRREHELRETRQNLKLALEATGFGLWSLDLTHDTLFWDERMLALHGCTAPPSPPMDYVEKLVYPDDRASVRLAFEQTISTGVFHQDPYRVVWPNGTIRWLFTVGSVLHDEQGNARTVVGGTLDATRQRQLEEQVHKGQRMDALAKLTAGVAHNFNNMLAVIVPILELATTVVPESFQSMLNDGSHAASRSVELVRQLMAYASPSHVPVRTRTEVRSIVEAAVSLCRHAFDARIELHVNLPQPAIYVECDPGQLEQVLVNLLLNARDAITPVRLHPEERTASTQGEHRGRVTVTARVVDDGRAEPRAVIEVIDNGTGMSDAIRARMFEPFFTTKPVGKGTGLGLATSYAIVRDHGGALSCASTLGSGSCFTVSLPRAAPGNPVSSPSRS